MALFYKPEYDAAISAFSMSNPMSFCRANEMWGYAILFNGAGALHGSWNLMLHPGRKQHSIINGLVERHALHRLSYSRFYFVYYQWYVWCFCFCSIPAPPEKVSLACDGARSHLNRMDIDTNPAYSDPLFPSLHLSIRWNCPYDSGMDALARQQKASLNPSSE
jgi:hypothetical protein